MCLCSRMQLWFFFFKAIKNVIKGASFQHTHFLFRLMHHDLMLYNLCRYYMLSRWVLEVMNVYGKLSSKNAVCCHERNIKCSSSIFESFVLLKIIKHIIHFCRKYFKEHSRSFPRTTKILEIPVSLRGNQTNQIHKIKNQIPQNRI